MSDEQRSLRRDRWNENVPETGRLTKVHTALGKLEREPARSSDFSNIKTSLLAHGRRMTMADIRGVPRVVRFDRSSPLADLGYVALPGLTTRVATRASLSSMPSTLSRNSSYLRIALLDSNKSTRPDGGAGYDPAYEPEDYVEESGFTPALKKTVAVALLSSFQFGLNNGNMNTPADVVRAALGIPSSAGASADNIWALCVSLFCVGALLGCNLSASLADKWGRRPFLLVSATVYLAGGLLEAACALPPGPALPSSPVWSRVLLLVVGRLVTGVACGGSTVVVPMYLGEVSPAALRGTLGTAFQLTCVVAMTLAQVLGLPAVLGTPQRWPLVFAFVALPALLQLLLGRLLVESPRWHCAVGNIDEAQATLQLLRDAGPTDEELLEELDVMITATESLGRSSSSGGYGKGGDRAGPGLRALFQPPTRYPLLIAMTVMVVQQFSGINNAFNYSSVFLKANGMGEGTVTTIAILMNLGNVLITLLSVYLMDKAGRRALLLLSTVGMAASTLILTAALKLPGRSFTPTLSVLAVLVFVSAFGIGLGPIPWLLPAEILPGETRALASSVAASTNWLANFIASQAFLLIANLLGGYAFLPFGGALVLGTLFVMRVVPETKGKSLEQIQTELAFS